MKICLNKYKSQEMCDKAVNACPPLLKFVLDWFVICHKMLEDLNVFFNDNIVVVNADSDVTFLLMI